MLLPGQQARFRPLHWDFTVDCGPTMDGKIRLFVDKFDFAPVYLLRLHLFIELLIAKFV